MNGTDQKTEAVPQTLSHFLENHADGETNYDGSVALRDVVAAVVEHRKKGTVTITIAIEPANGDASRVQVTAKIDTKKPKRGSSPALFFTSENGALLRSNPRQTTMREVLGDQQNRE